MNLKTKFDSKATAIDVQPFRIAAVAELDKAKWDYFSTHLLEDNPIVSKFSEDMYVDGNGTINSLLVLKKGSAEGILVNSEGSDYARYSAYLPFARPHLEYEINRLADYCVTEGCGNTSDGLWAISFDELWEHFDMQATRQNGIASMLVDELNNREEVAEAKLEEDEIELTYHLQYCPNCNPNINVQGFSLLSLLECSVEDVQFTCADSDQVTELIGSIDRATLTNEGMKEWGDVLNAKVERVGTNYDGVLVTLTGCTFERLNEFASAYSSFESGWSNKHHWFHSMDEPMPDLKGYETIDEAEFELRYAKHVLWLNDIPGGEQADFSKCIFDKVSMKDRKLNCAIFRDAYLVDCNLDGAELCYASCNGIFIDRCSMKYLTADEIAMRDATIKNSDLSYLLAYHGNFARTNFYFCDMFNGKVQSSCLEDTQFTHTKLDEMYIDIDDGITDEAWTNSPDGVVMKYECN